MKITEQPGCVMKQEEWDLLAALLVKTGYGVLCGKEKDQGATKQRKTIQLLTKEQFIGGAGL